LSKKLKRTGKPARLNQKRSKNLTNGDKTIALIKT
jgi:hypothetical protein